MSVFAEQIAAFAAKAQGRIDAAIRATVVEVGNRLIELSPEGTGHFKANFNYGLNAANTAVSEGRTGRTLNYIGAMPAHPGGARHYISNALPETAVLEFGGLGRPAHGMFGRTAAALGDIAAKAAKGAAQ